MVTPHCSILGAFQVPAKLSRKPQKSFTLRYN